MFVRAAEGRRVRHPDSLALLRPEGEQVPDTEYWFRRLREGDIEMTEPPKAEGEEPEGSPAAAETSNSVEHAPHEGDPE